MPTSDARPSLLSPVWDAARRAVVNAAARVAWGLGGGGRGMVGQVDAGARADSGGAGGNVARTDCGAGGCGPAPGWTSARAADALVAGGLTRDFIDGLCKEQLMRTIVNGIIDDAMTVSPKLSGETGELSACVPWLAERGYFEAQKLAACHARRYGGGGVVCFIDDGREADEEVDLLALRDVVAFSALPKWNLVPADNGSSRVRSAWYGPRVGRPEHYVVAPESTFTAALVAGGGGSTSSALQLRAGQRWHRSRIIPFPYVDELSLRQARLVPGWMGWGPGVVESCLAAYVTRRSGALRVADILQSLVYNVLQMPGVVGAQSTPDGGSALRNVLDWIKACLAYTGDGLPVIAMDTQSTLEPKSHTVTGISDLLGAQRQFLLDSLPEYTEVRLFGASATGLAGDSLAGQWRAYYGNVDSLLRNWLWTAGTFGGGMRQACLLAMACPDGPTGGVMDRTVEATWPSLWKDSAADRAKTRKADAEARAIDAVTLGLTPAAFIRHDPTVQEMLPSLDVDDGPLPQPDPDADEVSATAAQAPGGTDPATTPAKAIGALGEQGTPEAAPPVDPAETDEAGGQTAGASGDFVAPLDDTSTLAVLPADIHTEAEIAAALKMTRNAVRKIITAAGIAPVVRTGKGARGGDRYSLGVVMKALQEQATNRADALRDVMSRYGGA